jgi:hypothetical protein
VSHRAAEPIDRHVDPNDPELAAANDVARAALLNEISEELGEDWAIWID